MHCLDGSDEKEEECGLPPPTTPAPTPSTPAPTTPLPIVFPSPPPNTAIPECPHWLCNCPQPELAHYCIPCDEVLDLSTTCLTIGECVSLSIGNITLQILPKCGVPY